MTSYYAAYGALSRLSVDLYSRVGRRRDDYGREILDFYLSYLGDVVPYGVTVQEGTVFEDDARTLPRYYEMDLILTDTGNLFMSGLVSVVNDCRWIEQLAGDEAESKDRDGLFVRDNGTWRFFTATGRLHCYNHHGRGGWEMMGQFDPAQDAEVLAAHLQQQYDSLASH